ncbi:hypothetical protein RND71_008034 [Anisodus tanguticus]|uniref:Uncharacterized protein n=1 Tax=Anisodus tanguticus TaxID=243964 RepID=A0AAE1SMZ7_9SOLA|nr:hypothetical protein RND71_008034 [Anisodus tanguticus]
MDYKEKIEPCPATAADSIADGLGKNLSFDASDSTSRQPSKGPKEAKASAIDFAKFQNPFKRLITKVTKQADDDGSAGKLASLRNEGRGDPSIIS